MLAPLRAEGVAADLVGPVPYADFQCAIDDPPGLRNWWTADHLDALPATAIDTLAEHSLGCRPAPRSRSSSRGAAPSRGRRPRGRSPAATPPRRHPFMLWDDPARDAEHIAWARGVSAALRPYTNGGVYLNFVGDEGTDRVRAAFGDENLARLAAVKDRYDPHNVFRLNHNVRPVRAPAVRLS